VGFALTHFLSKAHHLPKERNHVSRAAELFWAVYHAEIHKLEWAELLEPRVVRHALGCLLARVAGRSTLEYLTPAEMARQREVVLALMLETPITVPNLIEQFIHGIETDAKN
jgi:hypothetical protein